MKIIQLSAENVKRLTAVTITPKGNVVVIGGANDQGKTSVLDAIAMALGGQGEIPPLPVRKGAKKAQVIAKLDNGLIIKRTFTAAGGTALVIENTDGARYPSPQSMLEGLTGKLMFDPLAFTRMDATKQAAALKKLLGLDFTALDAKRAGLYEERKLVNRDIERVRLQTEGLPLFKDAPAEPVSTADLVAELEKANKHNAGADALGKAFSDAETTRGARASACSSQRMAIAELERKLAEARKTLEQYEAVEKTATAAADEARRALAAFVVIETSEISKKLAGAGETNRQVQANRIRQDAVNAITAKMENAATLTAQIDAIDAEKEAQLAKAPFPIEGLGFDDTGVTFNGVPFSQASGAGQMRAAVAISAALNPKLRVMIVRDGSLLDEKSMALLAELAEKHNLQVFIERVGKSDECSIVIEDGTIAGQVQPEEESAPLAPVVEVIAAAAPPAASEPFSLN